MVREGAAGLLTANGLLPGCGDVECGHTVDLYPDSYAVFPSRTKSGGIVERLPASEAEKDNGVTDA